ncbi:unnamed protein product [Zymoseptoria tritici ST99CH_1A5]|uniref:Uncharacterized protein n=1 Tax=Zymoseptoria tritici ST99CH_1A5 TaxID=1276529 RepID=A0A1Y6LZR1_ZYMTR|nr:unnamed protein product [Zymoseptoria tritici ST99CH_1A5]
MPLDEDVRRSVEYEVRTLAKLIARPTTDSELSNRLAPTLRGCIERTGDMKRSHASSPDLRSHAIAERIVDAARRQHPPSSTAHHPTAQQPGIATASLQTLTHSPPLIDSSPLAHSPPLTHSPPFQCSSCDIVRAASQEYSVGTEFCPWCVDGTLFLYPESEFQWCHASRHEVNATHIAYTNILPGGDQFTVCTACHSSSQRESLTSDGSQRLPSASQSSHRPRSGESDDEYGTPFPSRGPEIDEFLHDEEHVVHSEHDGEEMDDLLTTQHYEEEDDGEEIDDLRLHDHDEGDNDGGKEPEDEEDEVDDLRLHEYDEEEDDFMQLDDDDGDESYDNTGYEDD